MTFNPNTLPSTLFYLHRYHDYISDELMGPLPWYEYITGLWHCLWNADLYNN